MTSAPFLWIAHTTASYGSLPPQIAALVESDSRRVRILVHLVGDERACLFSVRNLSSPSTKQEGSYLAKTIEDVNDYALNQLSPHSYRGERTLYEQLIQNRLMHIGNVLFPWPPPPSPVEEALAILSRIERHLASLCHPAKDPHPPAHDHVADPSSAPRPHR